VSSRTLIHVGFCHSGTTSLQENFFASRRDIFYCTSVAEYGGIFSYIKYEEDCALVERRLDELCGQYIWANIKPNQNLVLSDETLVEQPEVYYTPQKMPISLVAQRLKHAFPDALILFTIRNQFEYVVSCYLNLKRNYARFANRSIEGFDAWFAGNFTQMANLYMRHLDYSRAIAIFASVFGADAITVLPLESLELLGTQAYLGRVGKLIGVEITKEDVENFRPIQNRRISALENAILTYWNNPAYRVLYASLAAAIGRDRLRELLDRAEPAKIALNNDQIAVIHRRCASGHLSLEREFGLDLSALGYPMPYTEPHLIHFRRSRSLAQRLPLRAASRQRAAAC
jgi:hypothetical protein